MKQVIKNYLSYLQTADLDKLLSLFSEDATVSSPLYGEVSAKQFYSDLFKDTSSSKITLLDIFLNKDETSVAAHFEYDWVLSDGTAAPFEVVDVFYFNPAGKIQQLKIVYDASNTRDKLRNLRENNKN